MSYNCDLEVKELNGKQIEFATMLLRFRPSFSGKIENEKVIQYPYDFSDNVSNAVINFMEKYKLSGKFIFIDYELDTIDEDDEDYDDSEPYYGSEQNYVFVDGLKIE